MNNFLSTSAQEWHME